METEEEDYHVSEKYLTIRRCIQCKLTFNEIDNIGRHQCRLHPGIRLCDRQKREYYSCCGIYADAYYDGLITSMDLAGCVAIDHMDETSLPRGETQLNKTQLNTRLSQIKAFAVIVVPKAMIKSCKVIPPNLTSIIFNYHGGFERLPLSPMIERNLHVFQQIRTNHDILSTEHNPYNFGHTYVSPHIENTYINTKQDVLSINIHTISVAIDKQALVASIDEARKRNAAYSHEGWADVSLLKKEEDEDDGDNNALSLMRGRRKEGTAFMVIKRIDDKLNVHKFHSKLSQL